MILAGASCRALAQSFARAGFFPICFDLFADSDLRAIARVQSIRMEEWPLAMLPLLKPLAGIPFVFTGGLENHTDFLDEVTKNHPFWGNKPDIYQPLRDPFFLSGALKSVGIGFPEVSVPGAPTPMDPKWLLKPFAGSGGIGIRQMKRRSLGQNDPEACPGGYYAQRFIPGEDLSISFLLGKIGPTQLMISRGLPIRDLLGASEMIYAGNHLPEIPFGGINEGVFQKLGTLLWNQGLRGLVGVDGRIDTCGEFFVLEVNPRYTASMELGEMSQDISFAKLHAECFGDSHQENGIQGTLPKSGFRPISVGNPLTKAVLYARSEIHLSPDGKWPEKFNAFEEKHKIGLCDRPPPGSIVAKGAPILTIIEKGTRWGDLKDRFGFIVEDLRNQLEHS